MSGQSKSIGIGNSNGGGPLSTGGPLGGPGRPGKRLVTAQSDMGNRTGPGTPVNPMREVTTQKNGAKNNPANPDMD